MGPRRWGSIPELEVPKSLQRLEKASFTKTELSAPRDRAPPPPALKLTSEELRGPPMSPPPTPMEAETITFGGWSVLWDAKESRMFYFNASTGQASTKRPECVPMSAKPLNVPGDDPRSPESEALVETLVASCAARRALGLHGSPEQKSVLVSSKEDDMGVGDDPFSFMSSSGASWRRNAEFRDREVWRIGMMCRQLEHLNKLMGADRPKEEGKEASDVNVPQTPPKLQGRHILAGSSSPDELFAGRTVQERAATWLASQKSRIEQLQEEEKRIRMEVQRAENAKRRAAAEAAARRRSKVMTGITAAKKVQAHWRALVARRRLRRDGKKELDRLRQERDLKLAVQRAETRKGGYAARRTVQTMEAERSRESYLSKDHPEDVAPGEIYETKKTLARPKTTAERQRDAYGSRRKRDHDERVAAEAESMARERASGDDEESVSSSASRQAALDSMAAVQRTRAKEEAAALLLSRVARQVTLEKQDRRHRKVAWRRSMRVPDKTRLLRLFRHLDTSGDGVIGAQEWLEATTHRLASRQNAGHEDNPWSHYDAGHTDELPIASSADAMAVFAAIDRDNSSTIDQDEFCRYLLSTKDDRALDWMQAALIDLLEPEQMASPRERVKLQRLRKRQETSRRLSAERDASTSRKELARKFYLHCGGDGTHISDLVAHLRHGPHSCHLTVTPVAHVRLYKALKDELKKQPAELRDTVEGFAQAVDSLADPGFDEWLIGWSPEM